jgi:L-malate glycosyltransferase
MPRCLRVTSRNFAGRSYVSGVTRQATIGRTTSHSTTPAWSRALPDQSTIDSPAAAAAPVRVMHIASGDLWAGAEVQICTLLVHLQRRSAVDLHAIIMNEGELARRLRAGGVATTVIDESQFSGIAILRQIRRVMKAFAPHIVHTHRQKEHVLGALANAASHRATMVRTQHGAPEHRPRWSQPSRLVNAALDRWCGRLSRAHVIAVAPHLAPTLARTFGSGRVVVIENGIDAAAVVDAQRTAPFRQAAREAIHVGLIGRLEPVKRADIFLEVAAMLSAAPDGSAWRFHIFGDGHLRRALEQQCTQLGLDDVVTFHGHDPMAPCYLADLDVLVICSDHEGLPMTVLEARAVGTPIAAHAVGGIPLPLAGYERAVLLPSQDPQAFSDAIRGLVARFRTRRGDKRPARAEDRFDAAVNAERTLALYTTLTGAHAATGPTMIS